MNPIVLCPHCHQPLMRMLFNKHYIWLCDNWRCNAYRAHYLIEAATINSSSNKQGKKKSEEPAYPSHLERRKPKRRERYRAIRNLGVDSRTALRYRDMPLVTLDDIRELESLHEN